MMVLEKRFCPSAKIRHTVSCNISLYRDTKEVIYRYTQNVYRCTSTSKLEPQYKNNWTPTIGTRFCTDHFTTGKLLRKYSNSTARNLF